VTRSAPVRIGALLVLFAAAAFLVARLVPSRSVEPLPVISELPPFTLTEASGKPVSLADLRGQPWVADLIFTSCGGICPAMTQEMARLQKQTADVPNVRLVSISVDPETDTPERLTEYAMRFGADRERWLFLTGDGAAIQKLAQEGLLLPTAKGDEARGDEAVIHSPRFVLIDSQARVRGTYDMRDAEAMQRLRIDLRRLLEEG
jgi:protein SCO1/2